MEKLAAAHHTSLGQEIQSAMRLWINRHRKPHLNDIGAAIIMLAEEVERRTHQNVKEDAFASRTFTDQVPGVLARFIAEPIEATDNTRTMGWLSAETVFAFLDKGIKS
jgi:hypothetical protein